MTFKSANKMLYPNFVKYDKIIFSSLKQYLAPKSVKSWVSHPMALCARINHGIKSCFQVISISSKCRCNFGARKINCVELQCCRLSWNYQRSTFLLRRPSLICLRP